MRKPRKGNNHVRATGRAVHVPDHTYASKQSNNEPWENRGDGRAQLAQLAEEPPATGFTPTRRVGRSFGIGEPVETKPDWLETEIGRVDFTEDLILGFQSIPLPVAKSDAWKIVTEAADRYARLTAFIAAEQGITCEELCSRYGRVPSFPLPEEALEALERKRIHDSQDEDDLAEKITYTLDGTFEEDEEKLLLAAAGCYNYLHFNADELEVNGEFNGEHSLKAAIYLSVSTGPDDNLDENEFSITRNWATKFEDGKTSSQILLDWASPDVLTSLEDSTERPEGLPFVEECNAGIRINVTGEHSIELELRSEAILIRRVIKENGKSYYMPSEVIKRKSFESLDKLVMNAADFSAPIRIAESNKNTMIGFQKREALRKTHPKKTTQTST